MNQRQFVEGDLIRVSDEIAYLGNEYVRTACNEQCFINPEMCKMAGHTVKIESSGGGGIYGVWFEGEYWWLPDTLLFPVKFAAAVEALF